MTNSSDLIKAVAVTAELCGRTFTQAAASAFLEDLAEYPEAQVLKALSRCRKEVRGILTLSDVINRLEDGRPGVEEAWAMVPRDERITGLWTEEMAQAWHIARAHIRCGEDVAARMSFKEAYVRLLGDARASGRKVVWSVTLGHDVDGRLPVLNEAVRVGRISKDYALEIVRAPVQNSPFESLLRGNPKPLLGMHIGQSKVTAANAIKNMQGMFVGKIRGSDSNG